jgi:hypothetical protein
MALKQYSFLGNDCKQTGSYGNSLRATVRYCWPRPVPRGYNKMLKKSKVVGREAPFRQGLSMEAED